MKSKATSVGPELALVPETGEAKFERIAKRRVRNALYHMRRLRKCAGPGYSFEAWQVERMVEALNAEVEAIRVAFADKTETEFSF